MLQCVTRGVLWGFDAALGVCVCSGDLTRPCPFHAVVYQLEVLRLSHVVSYLCSRRSAVASWISGTW